MDLSFSINLKETDAWKFYMKFRKQHERVPHIKETDMALSM